MRSFLLQMPYQTTWRIEADCPRVIALLGMEYGGYITEVEVGGMADFCIGEGEGADYEIRVGEEFYHSEAPVHFLSRYLFEHPTYAPEVLAWHGAAVEWQGRAYVFLAATTTGKTTLTSYLVHSGFGYLTDDCVLLDRAELKVHPFSTPLHLREGGVAVLRDRGALPEILVCFEEKQGLCRYVYTPKTCVKQSLPLGEIFFLTRTESENALLPISSNDKLAALLRAPITEYPVTGDYLRFLSSVGKCYGKRLKYADMDFVKEVIMGYGK